MSPWKYVSRTCLAAGLGLLIGTTAQGEDGFDKEIQAIVNDIAPQIKEYIKKHPGRTVSVGTFASLSDKLPKRGTDITRGLSEGLTKAGIKLEERSGRLRIEGTFEPGPDEETGKPSTKITYWVKDLSIPGKDGLIIEKYRLLVGQEATIKLNGETVSTPPKATEKQRDEAVIKASEKPNAFVKKSIVRTKEESPYGMEIRVDGQPRDVVLKNGVPYLSLKAGEQIVVRLINDSRREAAVSLSIDGINSFSFQEKDPGAKTAPMNDWTVKPSASGFIAGWYINPRKWKLFKMTEDPKEIAALMVSDDSSDVGTITAVFKASWGVNESTPDDEPKVQVVSNGKSPKTQPDLGFAQGSEAEIDAKPRETRYGVIRDSITIRYQKIVADREPLAAEAPTAMP